MDDKGHGVKATVIDLGLSRMDAGDGQHGAKVHWTPFDEEIFMGEGRMSHAVDDGMGSWHSTGDYQFDVYRYMRDYNRDDWEDFKPMTNVMVGPHLASGPSFRRLTFCRPVASLPCEETPAFQEAQGSGSPAQAAIHRSAFHGT